MYSIELTAWVWVDCTENSDEQRFFISALLRAPSCIFDATRHLFKDLAVIFNNASL